MKHETGSSSVHHDSPLHLCVLLYFDSLALFRKRQTALFDHLGMRTCLKEP